MNKKNRLEITFLGDSITDANWIKHNFVSLLGEYLNADTRNLGISGATVGVCKNSKSPYDNFLSELGRIDHKTDFIVMMGGTNDFGSTPNQAVDLGEENSLDTSTFYGALNYISSYLLSFISPSKVIFMTPLRRDNKRIGFPKGEINDFGYSLNDYRKAVIKVSRKNSFKLIDLYEDFTPFYLDNPLFKTLSDDGLHPNDEGHKVLAMYLKGRLEPLIKDAKSLLSRNTDSKEQ